MATFFAILKFNDVNWNENFRLIERLNHPILNSLVNILVLQSSIIHWIHTLDHGRIYDPAKKKSFYNAILVNKMIQLDALS